MIRLPETVRIDGGDFTLRDWRDADAPALEPVCGEWDVCKFTSVPWTYTEEEALAWIDRQRRKRMDGAVLALAVVEPGDTLPVGNVNLGRFDDDQAEVGYWLAPGARGRGLATGAVGSLIDWGAANLGLRRVEFAILPDNSASHGVARRLGAVAEGIRERAHEAGGRWWDMDIYSVERGG